MLIGNVEVILKGQTFFLLESSRKTKKEKERTVIERQERTYREY